MFRFLCAMAAVKMGLLRELKRGDVRGTRVVYLISEEDERCYAVEDRQLRAPEAAAVVREGLDRGVRLPRAELARLCALLRARPEGGDAPP